MPHEHIDQSMGCVGFCLIALVLFGAVTVLFFFGVGVAAAYKVFF